MRAGLVDAGRLHDFARTRAVLHNLLAHHRQTTRCSIHTQRIASAPVRRRPARREVQSPHAVNDRLLQTRTLAGRVRNTAGKRRRLRKAQFVVHAHHVTAVVELICNRLAFRRNVVVLQIVAVLHRSDLRRHGQVFQQQLRTLCGPAPLLHGYHAPRKLRIILLDRVHIRDSGRVVAQVHAEPVVVLRAGQQRGVRFIRISGVLR